MLISYMCTLWQNSDINAILNIYYTSYRSFTFRNSYHFLDYNITNDSPLTIISHEMAITSDPGNSVKSIIDTRVSKPL